MANPLNRVEFYDRSYIDQLEANLRGSTGPTTSRPQSAPVGTVYFDVDLGKPIWWNGSAWVDATGTTV